MYTEFYRLHSKPFSINPDPEFFFMSKKHRLALNHLQYALMEKMPITVILGSVGTGKTTLIHYLLNRLKEKRIQTALIVQPFLTTEEFLRLIASEFELSINGMGKSEILKALTNFFIQEYVKKGRVFLLIDEAQNLPIETIEEIRMLTNIATKKEPLLQIVMLGQLSLREKLLLPQMEQFLQRVAVSYTLKSLDMEETEQYIVHRLKVSGRITQDLFTKEAIQEIYHHSQGIPRLINTLCDSCLVYGFGENLKQIDRDLVNNVFKIKEETGLSVKKNQKRNSKDANIIQNDISIRLKNIEDALVALKQKVDALETEIKKALSSR